MVSNLCTIEQASPKSYNSGDTTSRTPHIAHLDEILRLQKKISKIIEAYGSNCNLDPRNAQNDTHMMSKYKLKVVDTH